MKFFRSRNTWVLISTLLLIYCGSLKVQLWNERELTSYFKAYVEFSGKVASNACAGVHDIKQSAEQMGFRLDGNVLEWRNESKWGKPAEKQLEEDTTSVRVFVEPSAPFKKEPGQVISFDANGCVEN